MMGGAQSDISWTVFVEGKDDKRFLKCFLRHIELSGVQVERIGGGVSYLCHASPQIRKAHDSGQRIAVILDANSDSVTRREQFNCVKEKNDLPVERLFLVPNDKEPGHLETLLEAVAVSGHRAIYGCLDAYEKCLTAHCESYLGPQPKGRIYAYCEANGIEPREVKRCYDDTLYWNLDSPDLEPLRNFLESLRM